MTRFERCVCIVFTCFMFVPVVSAFEGHETTLPAAHLSRALLMAQKPALTAEEMETLAMEFVSQNHPELVELLNQLKTTNPQQHSQAMRDLSKAATTLATTERNDPKRYVLDLRAWQTNSQIQVLAARLAMSPSPELKEELRGKLIEQVDIRLEQQKLDRERTLARLKRLEESIAKLESSREQEAARAFDRLTRSTPKPAKKANKSASGTKTKTVPNER